MQANSGGFGSQPPGHHGLPGPSGPNSFGAMPWNPVAPPSHEEERDIDEKLVALEQYVNEQTAQARQGLVPTPPRLWDMDIVRRAQLYSGLIDRYWASQHSYFQRTEEACREFRQRSQATLVQQSSGSNYSTVTQKQPMQHKQGSPAPTPTPKQPMQKQGSSALRDSQKQASQLRPLSPPKRQPLAVDEDFLREMRALMGQGPSEEDKPPCNPPVIKQNPRQRGGPCGRSSDEAAILSGRGLCFRCGVRGHRATDTDASCEGQAVTPAAAIPALSRASSARSSAAKTNPAPAATASSTASMGTASGNAPAAIASAYLFGDAHSRPAVGRTVAPIGMLPTSTVVGWTRWESHAGYEIQQVRLDDDGKPWMKGDKILSAEKLDPLEYGGTRNDRDLGLCKTWFLLGRCDFDWFWCPLRHWKPEGCERVWMSNEWWSKHMEKFTFPLLPPDHPVAKYAGAPRIYFNGTQFIPRQLIEAETPAINAWSNTKSFQQSACTDSAGISPIVNCSGDEQEWAEESEAAAQEPQLEKAPRRQKRRGFGGQGRSRGGRGQGPEQWRGGGG